MRNMKNIFITIILCLNLEAKDFAMDCNQCIIGIGWTETELDLIKKRMGEDNFYIVADDANYYSYKLWKYIEANGIGYKHISRLEEDYKRIIFPNAIIEIKDREKDSIKVYYMYQKGKEPYRLRDISAPEDEINAYFNITNLK